MGKPEVLMHNWYLMNVGNEYILRGDVKNHPKLGNARNILTSRFVGAILEDDVLYYETLNTIYKCPLKYLNADYYTLNIKEYNNVRKDIPLQSEFKQLNDLFNSILRISVKRGRITLTDFDKHLKDLVESGKKELIDLKELEKQHLIEEVSKYESSVYLELTSIHHGDNLAYNINGKIGIVEPQSHIGTFTDSILYCNDTVDFRYFIRSNGFEIYHWSDGIDKLVIKNLKGYGVYINSTLVDPGMTVEIKNDSRDSLVSPDSVNKE